MALYTLRRNYFEKVCVYVCVCVCVCRVKGGVTEGFQAKGWLDFLAWLHAERMD